MTILMKDTYLLAYFFVMSNWYFFVFLKNTIFLDSQTSHANLLFPVSPLHAGQSHLTLHDTN